MNETLQTMLTRHSVRSYKPDLIDDETIDLILSAGQRAPTSVNGQQVSVIVVRDAEKRKRLSEIARGQPWIAAAPVFLTVIMDFNKTAEAIAIAGDQQIIQESAEGLMVGAVDVGLVLGNMLNAAHALGLGAVPIGAIRNDSQAVIDLLKLPRLTFPVAGMAMGHIDQDGPLRPRLSLDSFRHDEIYHDEKNVPAIQSYDTDLYNFWQQVGRPDPEKWTDHMAETYRSVYFRNVKEVLERQGFIIKT